jgi:K+-transporting ATPase ATPase C chain
MLSTLPNELLRALRLTLVFAVLTGILYPLLITGIAQVAFPSQANGSLIKKDGQVVGSSLIGQQFQDSRYFHGRPSATSSVTDSTKPEPYNAQNSGSSNLAPSNQALIYRVSAAVADINSTEYNVPAEGVPADMVTVDFSGLDPDISVANAMIQAERVARVRGLDPAKVRALVDKYTDGRVLWIFGEPQVNVLKINLALDRGEAG